MRAVASSFRDNAGHLFEQDGVLYRAVTAAGLSGYRALMESGLYDELAGAGLLVPHQEVAAPAGSGVEVLRVLRPERLPFVSWPWEWCFSQLRDAALLTLEVHRRALEKGLSLKDASFFNVQFRGVSPVFIDTLSFELRRDVPWVAYRQFCQHFLGPLALMSMTLPGIAQWLAMRIDGFPLSDACRLLPWRARLRPGLLMHLYLHSAAQARYESGAGPPSARAGAGTFGLTRQLALVDSLKSAVAGLRPRGGRTEWSHYAGEASHYTPEAEEAKRSFVERHASRAGGMLWDLGGNVGRYSRLGSRHGMYAVCFDGDAGCVERAYRSAREERIERFHPLVLDLANPSPGAGWAHRERAGLAERGPADLLLALALVHHLRITANIPFDRMLSFFHAIGREAIVEFVPKDDGMTRRLLRSRADVFDDYDRPGFERAVSALFSVEEVLDLPGTQRTLYHLRRR
jgi:hypothetical protein